MILKTSKFFAGFALLIMIVFTACSKDETTPYNSIDDFFEQQQDLQTFTVNADNNISIEGKKGTIVSIPAASIQDDLGNLVTGDVTVELIEIFTKSEMILNNKPTNLNDGGMLVSAGEFYLKVKKGEESLSTSNGVTFDFQVRENVTNPSEMSIWRPADSFERGFSWDGNSAELGILAFDIEKQAMKMSTFWDNSFNWLNCDYRFVSPNPLTRISARPVNLTTDLSNVGTFIAFKSINSVIGMMSISDGFQSIEIPIGEEVDVVMIGVGEEGIFIGVETVTVSELLELEIEMKKVTEENLKEELKTLD